MAVYASIDIAAMGTMVSSADTASTELPYDNYGFCAILNPVEVDTSPASGLTAVSAWLIAAIPDLKRRLALAQSIESKRPGFQSVVQIDESQLSTLDPTSAVNLGAADAKLLHDTEGPLDPTLLAEIAKNADDPYFASGFAKNLTPAEMAAIVQNGSDQVHGAPVTADQATAAFAQYQQLVSAMGTTVGTATRNTGALALPKDLAQQWSDTFTREPGNDGYTPNQAAALSVLLRYGTYSTPFLTKISTDAYNYERGKDGKPVWGPKQGVPTSVILDPTQKLGGGSANDVMANVLAGLGHNADAAQQFFDVGNPNASTVPLTIDGKTYQVNNRLEYLLVERTWSTDKLSDNGTGLGAALNAATTFYRNSDASGQVSATIASQAFAIIGSKTGDGASGGNWYALDLNSHPGWKMWDGMRTPVARMLASYAPDLLRTTGLPSSVSDDFSSGWTQASSSLLPPNGPTGASLNADLVGKILGTLGENPKDIDIVTTGVGVAGQLGMTYALQQAMKKDPGAAAALIKGLNVPGAIGSSNALAGAMSFVINSGYQGDKNSEDFKKAQAAALSKAMGIVLAAPSLAVPESAPWTGYLLEQAEDVALDKIGEGPDSDAKGTYNASAADAQRNLQQMVLNAVAASGALDPKNFAKAGKLYAPPPVPDAPATQPTPAQLAALQAQSALKLGPDGKPGQPPQFDFTSPAYNTWAQQGQNLQAFLNTNVVVPFRDRFPALGSS